MDIDSKFKIVNFDDWCQTCKNFKLDESEDPCNDCLNAPVNIDSRRPIHWEENPNAK